jgi:hypothetical protein
MQQQSEMQNILQPDTQLTDYAYRIITSGYEHSPDEEGIKTLSLL